MANKWFHDIFLTSLYEQYGVSFAPNPLSKKQTMVCINYMNASEVRNYDVVYRDSLNGIDVVVTIHHLGQGRKKADIRFVPNDEQAKTIRKNMLDDIRKDEYERRFFIKKARMSINSHERYMGFEQEKLDIAIKERNELISTGESVEDLEDEIRECIDFINQHQTEIDRLAEEIRYME